MTEDYINYPQMIDTAMRHMVRDVMRRVQSEGLPGEHHFFITFNTQFPGVKMSEQLREKYPRDITVVMQHQFWDFKVEDQQFTVTLSFGGAPEKLTVPFAALTAFADPSIKFGLQFQAAEIGDDFIIPTTTEMDGIESSIPFNEEVDEKIDSPAEIISLDAFRNK